MSKGKKVSKASGETNANWDLGLVNETIDDSSWSSYLVFLVPDNPNSDVHIKALSNVADGGNRKKFSVIDRESMLATAKDDAKLAAAAPTGGGGRKSKQSAPVTATTEKPLHVQVCEQVVNAVNSGDQVPAPLLVRMLKYMVLKKRTRDLAERNAKLKEATEPPKGQTSAGGEGKGKKGGGGRTSKAGGKKGKETPAVEATPAIPLPVKPPTTMKKRGEEDLDSKYINDEPSDGPSGYFLVTGFSSVELFQQLASVKLNAHVLFKVLGAADVPINVPDESAPTEPNEVEQAQLEEYSAKLISFWNGIDKAIKNSPSGSMLRDMAMLELPATKVTVPLAEEEKVVYGQELFDIVAHRVYHLLKQYSQYQQYLSYLDLQPLPLGPGECKSEQDPKTDQGEESCDKDVKASNHSGVDKRYYKELLSVVPEECTSIPLILHCMVEQVSATLSDSKPLSDAQSGNEIAPAIMEQLNSLFSVFAPPKDKKEDTSSDHDKLDRSAPSKDCTIIPYGDLAKEKTFQLKNSEQLDIAGCETTVNQLSGLATLLFPNQEVSSSHKADIHALEHFCLSEDVTPMGLNHALILMSLELIKLPNASTLPRQCYKNDSECKERLLFDHPFTIPIHAHPSEDKALLPVSQSSSAVGSLSEGPTGPLELDLPDPLVDLSNYSALKVLKKGALLQLLQSLQETHPYIELFHHQHSQATVLVVHSGFDGSPVYTYEFVSQAHSKVGFQNYLQYVAETYGSIIDQAVTEDAEKQEEFEEEQKAILEKKLQDLKLEEEKSASLQVEQESKPSGKGAKKSRLSTASSAKKSKATSKESTPRGSSIELTPSMPAFVKPKRFFGYDIGDRVLLTRCTHTTLFTSDGVQVHAERNIFVEGDLNISVSLLNKGHKISAVLTIKSSSDVEEPVSGPPSTTQEEGGQSNEEGESSQEEPVKGIPQPPSHVKYAALCASFKNSLEVSLSHYGPKANGELPYLPNKPSILDEPVRQGSSSGSRPQSQQGMSPQKLSKKQQEQQQQLLEQQRLLEEQQEKERKIAEKAFKEECIHFERHNKYQQLFANTEYGLHVHCQIQVDLDADVGITDGSDGAIVIRQSYPVKTKGVQLYEKNLGVAFQEKQRCYLPDGVVIRYLTDGTVVIQCADSSVYRSANKNETQMYKQLLKEVYPSSQKSEESIDVPPEAELVSAEASNRITSANRVMFADMKVKGGVSLPQERVWVITRPDGNRYLWKEDIIKPSGDGENTVDESAVKEEAPQDEANKEGTCVKEGNENIVSKVNLNPAFSLDPLCMFPATDPVTNEVYITREDNVVLLQRPDGSYISEFADRTRFTVTPTKSKKKSNAAVPSQVMTECPGFATVTHCLHDDKCQLEFPDGSTITCSTAGTYDISKGDDYKLKVNPDGKALYALPGGTYALSHTGEGNIFSGSDGQHNEYIVDENGVGSVVQANDTKLQMHQDFKPHYFVINSDHTAYEILNATLVKSTISKARKQSGTIVLKEPLFADSANSSTTIIEPLVRDDAISCVVPYREPTIVPVNLRPGDNTKLWESSQKDIQKPRRFGTTAGRGLMIGSYVKPSPVQPYVQPSALKYQQFLHLQPVDDTRRENVVSAVVSYIKWGQDQDKKSDEVQPIDERTDAEKIAADSLRAKWHQESDAFKASTLSLSSRYAQARSEEGRISVTMSIPRSPLVEAFLENSKKEIQEEEDIKEAIRHQIVPPYFESDDGKQFLQSQEPDMNLLSSKLARPKPASSQQQTSGHSTPSTLQSISMTLPLDDPVSPSQSELEPITSMSKLRPSHPTPDHAHGRGTPTEVRPTNPTPLQAVLSGVVPSKEPISDTTFGLPTATSEYSSSGRSPKSVLFDESVGHDSTILGTTTTATDGGDPPPQSVLKDGDSATGKTVGSDEVAPKIKINTKFATIEEPVRRKIRTSSTFGSGAGIMRGFEVSPDMIDFGVLREGSTYAFTLTAKNTGVDSCRFKIKQPPPSTGIKVLYSPGAVAAGMKRTITVEIFAMAVGAQGEHGMGSIYHELEIISETSILHLPIKATVLTSAVYNNRRPDHPSGDEAKGVKLVSTRPASREDVTRPQRV